MSSNPTEIVHSAINCTHVKAPCPACPYSRSVTPGALGGSDPTVYIGQAYGPFILPCHKHCNFDDPQWKQKSVNTPQCAGAAIFRANIGVDQLLPDAIHKLPANTDVVFASAEEFLAHHSGVSLREAKLFLKYVPPANLLEAQLAKCNIQFVVKD